ncbi:hypothetical protein [Brevundimonas sp.]|jgi:hypothetical protein|uniref:hypothetical protein n=1 Tax=Brevundimonas sp. TaxID=1871086 RepID=UPI0037BF64AA
MRRSLFACSVLALALTASACQRSETPPAEPAPAVQADARTSPAAPPVETPAPAPSVPTEDPQATIPEGPDMAPRPVPVSETPCSESIGEAAAARLVERCVQVSPATRPPCNAANPCALIQNEIDRSCKLWEREGNPPAECRAT